MTATGTEKKSVAILPFKNLSRDAASQFYEFSLADAVITELAQLKSLIVRPSSVIAKYQGTDTDPREAGRELRVHAVLSAGFMRSGNKMRVTAQLLDVLTGDILWSDRVDAESDDILALQDMIGQRILEGLELELSPKELARLGRARRKTPKPTRNSAGRDNFGSLYFRTVAMEDLRSGNRQFRALSSLTPFRAGHSGIGECYAPIAFSKHGNAEDTHSRIGFQQGLCCRM